MFDMNVNSFILYLIGRISQSYEGIHVMKKCQLTYIIT